MEYISKKVAAYGQFVLVIHIHYTYIYFLNKQSLISTPMDCAGGIPAEADYDPGLRRRF